MKTTKYLTKLGKKVLRDHGVVLCEYCGEKPATMIYEDMDYQEFEVCDNCGGRMDDDTKEPNNV